MNLPTTCPDDESLVGRVDMTKEQEEQVTEHVDSCETCQQRLESLITDGLRQDLDFEHLGDHLQRAAQKNATLSPDAIRELTEVLLDHTTVFQGKSHHTSLDFLGPSEDANSLGRLGQYEITEVIGRGGMGIALKGKDTRLDRIVAIKVLAPELASNPTARKRFLREAQAAAAVSHDHVITTYAVEPGDLPYIAMEYIDGQSLQQKLDRDGPLELREILRIGMQTAYGLAAAHAQGLIHRDIKPSNILLTNSVERVQITDFGLARAVDDVTITRTGEVTGTPQYMSPEQARGLPVDHRADLFSLGCVLYVMCTGRSPFRAESTMAVLNRVCNDSPRPISEVNSEIPGWLITIVDRLLEKEADDRFQTAAEVADLLSQYLAHVQQPVVVPLPEPPPALRSKRHNGRATGRPKWYVGGILLMVVLGSLGLSEATGVTQFAAAVISIARGDGTLVVEVNDPDVSVAIEGGDIVITGAGPKEVRLKPGDYRLRATKNGKPVSIDQELVSIRRGDRQVVRITLKPHEPEQAKERTSNASTQLIWADARGSQGAMSPDGRYLSFVWDDDLAVRNLVSGKNRRLTSEGSEEKGEASESVFSRDAKQIAYKWHNDETDNLELRVVGLDGSAPRVLQHGYFKEKAELLRPAGWTPDGKHILALVLANRAPQFVLVPLEDGPVKVLRTLDTRSPRFWDRHKTEFSASLSPNGRFVAYTFFPTDGDSAARDIAVVAMDGILESRLAEHPGDDFVLGWSPDGNYVVFASDRTGSMDVWAIAVANGKATGGAKLVKAEFARGYTLTYALGMTQDGSLCYRTFSGGAPFGINHIYVAPYDPQEGNVSGEPTVVTQHRWGSNWAPAWSPDGHHLAWVARSSFFNRKFPGPSGPYRFLIRSMETGEVRELSPKLNAFDERSLCWSPDGESLLGTLTGRGMLKIDVETGSTSSIAGWPGHYFSLAGDGNTVYDVTGRARWRPDATGWRISRRNLSGGRVLPPRAIEELFNFRDKDMDGKLTEDEIAEFPEPPRDNLLRADINGDGVVTRDELARSKIIPGSERTELFQGKDAISRLALSPDEKQLAFWDHGDSTLKLLPVDAEQPRELAETKYITSIDWTPDGSHLVYTVASSGQAWRIPVEGGEAQEFDLRMHKIGHIRFHPSGRQIAFTGNRSPEPRKNEVWVLENFLPRQTNMQENKNNTGSDN